jgi:hypothetical protein
MPALSEPLHLHFCHARQRERQRDNRYRQERYDGEEGHAVQLQPPIDGLCSRPKRVVALDNSRDEDREGEHDDDVERLEDPADGRVPTEGVMGAQDALRPDKVYDEDEEDAGCDEDLGGDSQTDVCWETDGGDAQCAGGYTSHTEA